MELDSGAWCRHRGIRAEADPRLKALVIGGGEPPTSPVEDCNQAMGSVGLGWAPASANDRCSGHTASYLGSVAIGSR